MDTMRKMNMIVDQKRLLSVQFERQENFYNGGELLRGFVVLELDRPMEVSGVEIKLYGGTCVKWTDTKSSTPNNASKVNIEHNVEEIYFKKVFILWGRGHLNSQSDVDILSAAKHIFPFRFPLPTDIPCSFEGIYGSVRYYACATVLGRRFSQNIETKVFITVLQDLLLDSETLGGLQKSQEVSLYSCFRSGHVSCTLSVPNCGFVPGQVIRADVHIVNRSRKKIKGATLSLKQMVRYGSYDSNKSRKVLWEVQHLHIGVMGPETCHNFEDLTLHVPSLPPSRLDCCQFIDIRYDLVLKLFLKKPRPLVLSLPIIIGTVPQGQDGANVGWEYKEQHKYPGARWRAFSVDGSHFDKVNDGTSCMPVYKFYHSAASCKYRILDKSPGLIKKKVHLRNDEEDANSESETAV